MSLAHELGDQLGQLLGLILRDERVRAVDRPQAGIRDELRETLAVRGREHLVLAGPGHERGPVERCKPLGRLERVPLVDPAQDLCGGATGLGARAERSAPRLESLLWWVLF